MSRVVTIQLDDALKERLVEHATGRGLSLSTHARDLLRRALGLVTTEYEAGYAEGEVAAHRDVLSGIHSKEPT